MRIFRAFWVLAACFLLALPTAAAAVNWHLTKVQMVSNTHGWALASTPCGSVLLRTADSGGDWQNVSPNGIWPLSPAQAAANENFAIGWEGIDFYGLSGQTCWVAMISEGKQIIVERTYDGGRHWGRSQFANRSGYSLLLSFLDSHYGWILTVSDMASGSTRKELYRTKNGGQTWAAVTDALPDHIDPQGMAFRNASEGWLAAGYHGSNQMPLYRTDDFGRHWRLQELDTSAVFQDYEGYGVLFPPSFFGTHQLKGILPVQFRGRVRETGPPFLYSTQDGGNTWRLLPLTSTVLYKAASVQFTSLKQGWVLEDNNPSPPLLLRTQDGGKRWRTVYPKQKKQL